MRLVSSEIPQADKLHDVLRVIEAVNSGAKTFQGISAYIGKVDRQGRYYRLAAELIGLLKNEKNTARLTNLGHKIINSSPRIRMELTFNAVFSSRVFQRVLPFFELNQKGVTRKQLEKFLLEVTTPTGPTLLKRRVSTILHWLQDLNILQKRGDRFSIDPSIFKSIPVLQFQEIDEPIMPMTGDLTEYTSTVERTSKMHGMINVMRDEAKFERANKIHGFLVSLIADKLRNVGVLPRSNELIDLAAKVHNVPFIFEMKSITQKNIRTQIRRSISQLYEYRYLQCLPNATLVVVVQKDLPSKAQWMRDYLEVDRDIKLIWNGRSKLHASSNTRKDMHFLWNE